MVVPSTFAREGLVFEPQPQAFSPAHLVATASGLLFALHTHRSRRLSRRQREEAPAKTRISLAPASKGSSLVAYESFCEISVVIQQDEIEHRNSAPADSRILYHLLTPFTPLLANRRIVAMKGPCGETNSAKGSQEGEDVLTWPAT